MSDATKMGDELLELANGRIPDTREWQTEIHLAKTPLTGSHNKPLVCNSAEMLFAREQNRPSRVAECLDWWAWYIHAAPICGGESLTGEEVYRAMMVYSSFVAAAVARATNHPAAADLLAYTRAHVTWLALGAGSGPGRKVQDHHLDNVGKPCVLIGDGNVLSALPYVAQAGARGWIRNRDGGPKTFHFTESVGLSAMIGQAAAYLVPRKGLAWQVDMFAATCALSPGVDPLGFSPADREILRAFLRNPADLALAVQLASWVARYAPGQPHVFIRYADGSVVTYMEQSIRSSTDPRMIDCWLAGGRTMKTSADDGLRSSSDPQKAWENPNSIFCQKLDGGVAITIPKPSSLEVYRVVTRDRVVTVSSGSPMPGPGPDVPPAPKPPKKRKRPWWRFW